MNTINNIGGTDPIQQLASNPISRSTAASATATPPAQPTDSLELSGVSYFINALKANNIRTDTVANVRSQIEAGTYEDDNKLNVAADKLLDDLLK